MFPHVRPPRRYGSAASLGLALICAGLLDRSAHATEPESINWRTDYGSALEEARVSNRVLWIQFTGPWCPNCNRMERDSFAHPNIIQEAGESFIPLKLRSDVHEQMALDFNLSGLPATVLVGPDRRIVATHQGYLGPDEFGAFLKGALAQVSSATKSKEAIASKSQKARGGDVSKIETQVALSGYCPVSLIQNHKLVQGQTQYTVTHEGRLYRFADRLMVDVFRREPARYIPLNGGVCPVSQLERGTRTPGNPRWGVLYKGQLFLCSTEADRKQFLTAPDRYSMVDVAEQGFCPHCIQESGLLVRGDAKHEIHRDGRRYWFPDLAHREAFLSATARR